ncbi:hypothetical protein IMSHALPRED_009858 [Imshaugia aleurites]|uniref:Uncharacterized protein n=1 Tax=Imshaugia aleurites TaxID=172621 RepID=A0A8H3G1D7_9LECA|nr:hypothetical protein IMSHALPRED_009858 [Imshaugia aleurites]
MLTSERVARADVVNLCHTRMSDEVYVDLLILTDMIAENCCISIGSYANLNQEDDRRPSLRFIPSAPSHPSSIGLMWRDTLWRQLHPNKAWGVIVLQFIITILTTLITDYINYKLAQRAAVPPPLPAMLRIRLLMTSRNLIYRESREMMRWDQVGLDVNMAELRQYGARDFIGMLTSLP